MPQPGTNPENSGPIADFNNSLAALVDYVKPAGEDILYQFAEEEILARARPFDSWPEWRDYEEKQNELNGIDADFGLETESVTPEGLSGAEADAWYRAKWEKAQGIKRDAAGKEIREAGELSTEEIDVMFLDRMEEGGALERFLEETWYTINPENIFGGVNTGEEDAAREEAEELARRVRNEMHPTVVNNARRVAAGKPLTGSARKAILTLMEKGARHYRALYTEITGDQEFAALAAREVKTKPDIRDPEGRPLSIVQKEQIARKIKNEEIQKKFLSGELVPEEVQSYVEDLRKEKRELQRRLEKAEEEIADDLQYLNRAERNAVRREKELSAAENTIRNYEREIERLEKDLARVRARRRLERQAAEEKNGARKKKESQKRADAAGQARERREKLENSYIRRLDKTRAMLREKRTRLEELEKEYGDFVRSARAQATMQKYVAVNRLKEQIREKIAERRAALKIIADKRRLVNDIMREPSKGIWYEHREKIRAIQRVIDPKVRRAKVIWKGEMYDINVFRDRAIAEGLAGILPKNLVTRVFRKSINEWTVGELEEMRDQVERLRLEGRYEWNRRELERKMGIDAAQRAAVNQNNMNPEYRPALAAGSKERKKQLEKLDTLFRKVGAGTWTLSRIAQWADGHAKGAHYKNLVTEERQVYAVKMDNMDRRYKRIFDFMKKIGKEIRDLYNREYTIRGIGPGNSDATFTVSDLMFMLVGLRDRNTRAAIIYGNMMNNDERNHTDATVLRKAGAEKMRILHDFVNRTLSAKEKALAEEIGNDFRDEFGRLNDIFANEFNRVMTRVNSYVPMITQDATASGNRHEKQQGNEILNVAGVSISRTPEKGFAVKRVKIGPRNQRAIRLDLFGTWMKAVERQEHFAAYNRYIRKLNAVYKGNSSTSRFLQEQIGQIYGPELLNRIKTEINALANPQSFKDERNIDLIIKVIRGNTAAAYLAFNVPSVLKQFAASPLPYMAHVNPVQYAASALRFLSNPVEFSRGIKEKSAIMRHRQANPAFGVLRQLQENSKGKRGLAAFQSAGMKGLEIADWVSVAVGWDAVYEKALAEGLSEQEAVARADDVTLQTQPSSREQDLPPLYKNQPEAMKIITQFTTSLNPIWNQFTYDLPVAVKNRQFGHAVSMLVAYGLAGWGIGAVTSLFSKDDDDDDEDTKRRRFLYWSFSQALDSVPLLGNGVSALAEQLITGQRRRQFTSPVFPAGQKLLDAASRAGAGDWDRAAQNLAEGIGIGIGAPVSATKQVFRIIRKE
ncbi:MAG: hypothetical protein LBP27_05760 [Treponema sp.]|jgi:hypothetical protein|nr:hypothetical protein [Treponema sp.]